MPLCESCGQDNPGIARFCLACGATLAVAPAAAREERKVVTVLFVDLVGFTPRAERLDPEDVGALLAPYWQRVRDELERHGGTVEKFIGDAVVALFGAPVAHEDDPERGVRAALAIRDWILEEGGDLQLRVAVTTGEALVRLGARPREGEGMASGDVVNTAARLQAVAPVNGVLVDETTFRATAHAIEYSSAPPVAVKGKAKSLLVWEAVEARSRFGVDMPSAYSTPLVGRRRELDDLRDALERARHDRAPQLVTLVGIPGIGKSRLVHELSRIADADPELVRWRQGRSLPYGEGASFWALAEMVKAEAGIMETDLERTVEAKLRQAVEDAVEEEAEREWVAARLRPLVGLSAGEASVGDRRSELFAAWRRFLEELADRRPTVLVFEDLHWADDDLLDFVDHLADWATGVPLLVVGTARPELLERRPGWGGGKRNALTISLAPLDETDTSHLLAALTRRSALPAELQRELLARAGGNPLYAEQYVRMLDERPKGGDLAVPETVQGLIAARLDGLQVEEKTLLQDAAVLGKVFWLGAVATIGSVDRADAEQRLHLLERKEFVVRARRSSVAGETEYAFGHSLVRDVAYNQIPRAARAEKHRRAAEWLAALGRPEDHADLLAHHYLAALELARAAGVATSDLTASALAALVDAGDRAAALNAFGAAARFYGEAVALAVPTDSGLAGILYRHARVQHELGQPGAALHLLRARDALLEANELGQAAEIATRLAHATWVAGDRDAAMEQLSLATELIRGLPPSEQTAYVLGNQSRFHMLASHGEEAIAAGEEALAIAETLGLDYLRAHILNTVGVARAQTGDTERGVAQLRESIAISERLNGVEAVRGYVNLASVLSLLGEHEESRRYHERGLELARGFGAVWAAIFLQGELALDRYDAGEWDASLADAADVIEATRTTPHLMEAAARTARGEILVARGEIESGLRESERVLEIGRGSKDPQTLFPSLAIHAELLVDAERFAEAQPLCDELLALTRQELHALEEWGVALAFALRALGRSSELAPIVETDVLRTRWRDAVAAIAAGELVEAAAALRDVGDLPHEAKARLLAAEELAAEGRRPEADAQLAAALGFYRSVGATRYVRRGEALLAATG